MRTTQSPSPVVLLAAIIIASLSALTLCWGLAAIARPSDLQERIAALESQAQRTQTLLRRRGGNADYPVGAVCPGLSEAEVASLRQRLGAIVTGGNLSLEKISVAKSAQPSFEAVTAVEVRLEVKGAYEPTLLMLDNLSRFTPLLYVDSVDLGSQTDAVNLQLSGRLYCWTSAPR